MEDGLFDSIWWTITNFNWNTKGFRYKYITLYVGLHNYGSDYDFVL